MMSVHHRGFSTLPELIFIQPEGLRAKDHFGVEGSSLAIQPA